VDEEPSGAAEEPSGAAEEPSGVAEEPGEVAAGGHLAVLLGGNEEEHCGGSADGARDCGRSGWREDEGVDGGGGGESLATTHCCSRWCMASSACCSTRMTCSTRASSSCSTTWWPTLSLGSKLCSSLSRRRWSTSRLYLCLLNPFHLASRVAMVAEGCGGLVESRERICLTSSMASSVLSFSLFQHLHLLCRSLTLLSSSSHSLPGRG